MKEKLTTLANWLQVTGQAIEEVMVTGVSIDSRTVKSGDLFIPFRGERVNGHQFVKKAFESGAVASLWMKDEPNPPTGVPLLFVENPEVALQEMARQYRKELPCTVIGVTGSNGKTSTKDLIAGLLSPFFQVQKTEGNYNNELGLPLTILSLEKTTQFAVLEMGMSGFGEISFLSDLAKPDYVIITNIGEAHLQDLGSREGIAKAKFEIIDGLASNGMLFYDGDEPLLEPLVKRHPSLQAQSFGHRADLMITSIATVEEGSCFTVSGLLEGTFTIPVYGTHQVKNALVALLIGQQAGLDSKQMQQALQQVALTDMRMQPIVVSNGALMINDAYNAAPTSMRAALNFMAETALREEKWLVLGDMLELGDQEQFFHEALANEIIALAPTGVLLYGPRMKWLYDKLEPLDIFSVLEWSEERYEPLIDILRKETGAQSIVLLKGSRGMALENVLTGLQNNGASTP